MKKKVIILGISITAFILGGVLLFSGNSNGIVSFFDIPKKGMTSIMDYQMSLLKRPTMF